MPKNYRKIPQSVLDKISVISVDDVVVACAKRLLPEDVALYGHLGLKMENGVLVVPPPAVPPGHMGKYSDININGTEVVRRDLPKIFKTITIEVPNWGDWSNGSHDVDQTREVYKREFIPPKELTLSIEQLSQQSGAAGLTLKFAVDEVLSRTAPDFEAELLYNLNILQENVGAVDVFASTATLADFIATIRLSWEILPPGNLDEVVRRMLQGKRQVSEPQQKVMRQRLAVLERLNPQNYIAGTNEFLRYFGAKFDDDLVAFENLNYGNALYVMFENWEALSRRSRIDLLKGPREGFERIPHDDGWEDRLKAILRRTRQRTDRR